MKIQELWLNAVLLSLLCNIICGGNIWSGPLSIGLRPGILEQRKIFTEHDKNEDPDIKLWTPEDHHRKPTGEFGQIGNDRSGGHNVGAGDEQSRISSNTPYEGSTPHIKAQNEVVPAHAGDHGKAGLNEQDRVTSEWKPIGDDPTLAIREIRVPDFKGYLGNGILEATLSGWNDLSGETKWASEETGKHPKRGRATEGNTGKWPSDAAQQDTADSWIPEAIHQHTTGGWTSEGIQQYNTGGWIPDANQQHTTDGQLSKENQQYSTSGWTFKGTQRQTAGGQPSEGTLQYNAGEWTPEGIQEQTTGKNLLKGIQQFNAGVWPAGGTQQQTTSGKSSEEAHQHNTGGWAIGGTPQQTTGGHPSEGTEQYSTGGWITGGNQQHSIGGHPSGETKQHSTGQWTTGGNEQHTTGGRPLQGTQQYNKEGMTNGGTQQQTAGGHPSEGTHQYNTGGQPSEGTHQYNTGGQPSEGTHQYNTGEQPSEGIHQYNTRGGPSEGINQYKTGRLPSKESQKYNKEGWGTGGTQQQTSGGHPSEGTHQYNTGGQPSEGTQQYNKEGWTNGGTQQQTAGGHPSEGTHQYNTGGQPSEGTHQYNTGGQPSEGTHQYNTGEQPSEGIHQYNTRGGPSEGINQYKTGRLPSKESQKYNKEGWGTGGTQQQTSGGHPSEAHSYNIGGHPSEGTHQYNTGGQTSEGTKQYNSGGWTLDGIQQQITGGKPSEGTEQYNAGGWAPIGIQQKNTRGQPSEGTQQQSTSGWTAEGPQHDTDPSWTPEVNQPHPDSDWKSKNTQQNTDSIWTNDEYEKHTDINWIPDGNRQQSDGNWTPMGDQHGVKNWKQEHRTENDNWVEGGKTDQTKAGPIQGVSDNNGVGFGTHFDTPPKETWNTITNDVIKSAWNPNDAPVIGGYNPTHEEERRKFGTDITQPSDHGNFGKWPNAEVGDNAITPEGHSGGIAHGFDTNWQRGDNQSPPPPFITGIPQGNYKGEDGTDHPYDDPYNSSPPEDSIVGVPGVDYPNHKTIPETGFDCSKQDFPGYFADMETGCQVYHICQSDGRHNSFLCPTGTIFNQKLFICNWWFDSDCAGSAEYYHLNQQLYREGDAQGNYKGTHYPGGPVPHFTPPINVRPSDAQFPFPHHAQAGNEIPGLNFRSGHGNTRESKGEKSGLDAYSGTQNDYTVNDHQSTYGSSRSQNDGDSSFAHHHHQQHKFDTDGYKTSHQSRSHPDSITDEQRFGIAHGENDGGFDSGNNVGGGEWILQTGRTETKGANAYDKSTAEKSYDLGTVANEEQTGSEIKVFNINIRPELRNRPFHFHMVAFGDHEDGHNHDENLYGKIEEEGRTKYDKSIFADESMIHGWRNNEFDHPLNATGDDFKNGTGSPMMIWVVSNFSEPTTSHDSDFNSIYENRTDNRLNPINPNDGFADLNKTWVGEINASNDSETDFISSAESNYNERRISIGKQRELPKEVVYPAESDVDGMESTSLTSNVSGTTKQESTTGRRHHKTADFATKRVDEGTDYIQRRNTGRVATDTSVKSRPQIGNQSAHRKGVFRSTHNNKALPSMGRSETTNESRNENIYTTKNVAGRKIAEKARYPEQSLNHMDRTRRSRSTVYASSFI